MAETVLYDKRMYYEYFTRDNFWKFYFIDFYKYFTTEKNIEKNIHGKRKKLILLIFGILD